MIKKPIKRHEALKPFSRDHHHGLLLCWKIREGFKRNIEPQRIKKYTDWFWETHLAQHFQEEEKILFPLLPQESDKIKKATAEHRRLKRLFENTTEIVKSLNRIEEELESHIRFEERDLFNEIQKTATTEQLQRIENLHKDNFCDNWVDEFWKN
ncbi:MAG: hemerythrin domain-containing protein [Flavobacteriaceae bacterium]